MSRYPIHKKYAKHVPFLFIPLKVYLIFVLFLIGACASTSYSPKGIPHVWQSKDTLEQLSQRYKISIFKLQKHNDIYDPKDLAPGMIVYIPGYKKSPKQPTYPQTTNQNKGRFIWPAKGTISSGYGPRQGRLHHGLDITQDSGRDIFASASGKVSFAGKQRGYGKTIVIDHGSGMKTLYAHNEKLYVRKGMRVKQGTIIAKMGSTGRSTGVHLHFEIRKNGVPQNPLRYLTIR